MCQIFLHPGALKQGFTHDIKNQTNFTTKILGVEMPPRLRKGYTKSDDFSESSKGGEVIFSPKIYIADYGNFKQGFLSMKSIQKRVSVFHTKEPVPWKNEAGSALQKESHCEACLEI